MTATLTAYRKDVQYLGLRWVGVCRLSDGRELDFPLWVYSRAEALDIARWLALREGVHGDDIAVIGEGDRQLALFEVGG